MTRRGGALVTLAIQGGLVLGTLLILRRIVGLPIALTIMGVSVLLGVVVNKLFR